jgi:hypothetical protein
MTSYRLIYQVLIISILLILVLSGCKSEEGAAAAAIESYIQALSGKDANKLSNLSCAEWEQSALTEMDSLTSVGSKVENLSCQESGKEGTKNFVNCTGALALDYDGEIQRIDLSTRTYIAVEEDGEWRMCGYK